MPGPYALFDYVLTFESGLYTVPLNEVVSLQWLLTRLDGGYVPQPTSATLTCVGSDGTTVTSISLNFSTPTIGSSILIGGAMTFAVAELYRCTLEVVVTPPEGPVQTRQAFVLIRVQ